MVCWLWLMVFNATFRKFYSDAVPMIGTTAAVKQIAKLILRNAITGRMAEIWLSSLSLVQNPSQFRNNFLYFWNIFTIFIFSTVGVHNHRSWKINSCSFW
jgi:uncharacterized metal-binding protein